MTDFSHDAGDDAFHEIQLSGKQLVFLFMATTVVSVVIFLCGVLVGRGVKTDTLAAANAATAPSSAGPTATPPAAESTPAAAPAAAPTADPPAPAADSPLTYPKTLGSEKPPTDALKPASEPKKTETPRKSEATKSVTPPPPAAAAPTTPAAAAPAPNPPPSPNATASRNGWAVQVVALTDRSAAMAVVQRLNGKGYPAFLVTPQAGAPVQNYKVQVGRYSERAEAEQIKTRLKKEEQFEPWILR